MNIKTILLTPDEEVFYAMKVDLDKRMGPQVMSNLINDRFAAVPKPHACVEGVFVLSAIYRLTNGGADEDGESWAKEHKADVPEPV